MAPTMIPAGGGAAVRSWADDLDEATLQQAKRSAALPFVEQPLALMADAHLGLGATIGSVIATHGAVIPAAVGVDLGCGMAALHLDVRAEDLPDDLGAVHAAVARAVPAGIPNRRSRDNGSHREDRVVPGSPLDHLLERAPGLVREDLGRTIRQFGTLGSGNHFVELCLDEGDDVWLVLHSGSRGIGNRLAQHHIDKAKGLMARRLQELPDPDLASFVEGTPEFDRYIHAMSWAQDYARENRSAMLGLARAAIEGPIGRPLRVTEEVQCHHNYCQREQHHGREVWVTRKGAIRAGVGDLGIIPGSMATGSFVVEGLGNPDSYQSASHGAGRRMSRTAARKRLSESSLEAAMAGIAWNRDARGLLDEHPQAYKDVETVMAAQSDLVRVVHRLETVLNYKGS